VQSGGTATTPLEAAEAFTDATPAGEPNSSNEILLRVLAPDMPRAEAKRHVAALAPADVATRLRALPAADLIRAYRRESQEGLIDVPQLFRDGFVLPASEPLEAVRAGRYNRIPTILGTNKDENKLFLAFNPEFTWRLFGLLPIVRDPVRYDATAQHLTQHWRARGVDEPATAMRPVQGPSVFAYRFDWDEEPKAFTIDVAQLVGAAHGFEIPFVFGHWDLGSQTKLLFSKGNEPGRLELARTMMAYWAAFARGGDPNGPRTAGLPRWEPFAVPEGRFLVFDTSAGGGVRMESGNVTSEAALAGVEQDATLATPEAKCDVYRQFVRWARQPSAADYPKMVAGACARFPLPAT
jgi:para-nitrobenzyl esterase